MSIRHKKYPFQTVKYLDQDIHWNPKKQYELRNRLENSLNKKHKRIKFSLPLVPLIGGITTLCIIGIFLASYISNEGIQEPVNATIPTEKITEAALSVEEKLNQDSVLHYVNLDVTNGTECNFYLNNVHGSYNYKYRVYAPDGRLVGVSTTAGTQERLYSVDLGKYGSGTYKIKVYAPTGNIGGQYQLRVRNF
ncbi:hypothetical protein V1503_19160 [Bacillus sp. SCS-151]|uniref:hypothetical protein n=1 Tax=Nanhaiella sioensis TaxID=3115293 RepID=UPI0039782D17